MRIEYENKFRDLLLFNAIHQFMSPVVNGFLLIFAAFIFGAELEHGTVLTAAKVALFWYVFVWVIQLAFNAVYLYSKKNHRFLTNHAIDLRNDGVFTESRFSTMLSYWHGVVSVVTRPGFVAIYLSPQLAHVIPDRAFASDNEKHAFVELARQKIAEHAQRAG